MVIHNANKQGFEHLNCNFSYTMTELFYLVMSCTTYTTSYKKNKIFTFSVFSAYCLVRHDSRYYSVLLPI